eukprot:TRINITY_DN63978_c0_g1_i1.p1 TRINITY_DN63978_c0_g1~~TRINITY_DN63978_c0_g1_i1.p1  ORF type:complete len:327 (-),score=3.52 TRINITY_DN63978_c0_g1_i1:252-1232(-)
MGASECSESSCLLSSHGTSKNYRQFEIMVALFLFIGLFHFDTIVMFTAIFHLPSKTSVAVIVLMITLVVLPINPHSKFGKRLATFIAKAVPTYFPIKFIYEDHAALDPKQAHIIALEPHHVFPISALALSPSSGLFPLTNLRILGSSALGLVPLVRHIWRWLGMGAATRKEFVKILASGTSCVIIPGGMQESLLMDETKEVLYLRRRLGFVRLAVENNVPLVPIFAFGQRDAYRFWFPRNNPFHASLSRKLMFAPMLFWGRWGTPIPFQVEMTLVVGRPVPVPACARDDPEAAVAAMHSAFVEAVDALYDKHKGALGAAHIPLEIV